jgi:hypothetical protein
VTLATDNKVRRAKTTAGVHRGCPAQATDCGPVVASRRKRPRDLTPGDIVIIEGALFEVLFEPFNGMSGTSMFDAPRLFWRVRVRSLSERPHRDGYATWGARDEVRLAGVAMERRGSALAHLSDAHGDAGGITRA